MTSQKLIFLTFVKCDWRHLCQTSWNRTCTFWAETKRTNR